MSEVDVSRAWILVATHWDGYRDKYADFFELNEGTPQSQFSLIPYLSETFAEWLMNTLDFKENLKRDFMRDKTTERWDLINSEGVTIEVKSTVKENTFRQNSVGTSIIAQRKSLIMKLFMEKSGINRMKFVRYKINDDDLGKPIEECKGKWINVTEETVHGNIWRQ